MDYRVHGLNHGAFLQLDDSRFAREVDVTRRRHKFFTEVAASVGLHVAEDALTRNMQFRLSSRRHRLRFDLTFIPSRTIERPMLSRIAFAR